MRTSLFKRCGAIGVAAITLGGVALLGVAPTGAATAAQTCTGPGAVDQSGRATLSPGVNALARKQTTTAKISLFQCSPSAPTGSSGQLTFTITTPTAQTCSLINAPQTLTGAAKVTWHNNASSTLSITIKTTGVGRRANVTGKVTGGLFANHTVTAQFRYKPVVSPNSHTVAEACANKVAPGGAGRISVVGLLFFTTHHFTVN